MKILIKEYIKRFNFNRKEKLKYLLILRKIKFDRIENERKKELFKREGLEKRGCAWCKDCKPLLSWWCKNKEAIKARGTSVAGCINCPFFTFDETKIEWEK